MTSPLKTKYPLHEVLLIKKRRVEDAERVVKEMQEKLNAEKEKLRKREEERNKVLNHRNDKLKQLRATLDKESTTPKIQQMKAYLKVVDQKLIVEEKKVADQKTQVDIAEKNLEMARHELKKKRLEVDKILQHKKGWTVELIKEFEIAEGRENDEIGNIIHSLNQRRTS